jgi:predicted nucleotidyltransferase
MCAKSEQTGENDRTRDPALLSLPLPVRDGDLFKHSATADIVHLLSQYPFSQYTLRELARRTDHSVNSVRSAVSVLEANDLVTVEQEGNARPVAINRSRLRLPDNPILSVPQSEFHLPLQVAVEKMHYELTGVEGIVLFGSVASGTADRKSDIDLWVLVADNRLHEQQTANQVAQTLSEVVFPTGATPPRTDPETTDGTALTDQRDPLERLPETDHGDRFDFQILVETPDSIVGRADDRIAEIVMDGIVLYRTETLSRVVKEVTARAG